MTEAYNMLDNLGVQVPCKVLRLKKPVNEFIQESGGEIAEWQKKKAAGGSVARAPTCSLESTATATTRSTWRENWRPHAHPSQRSHFSTTNPSSCVVDPEADTSPVFRNHLPLTHHRKVKTKPEAAEPREHPLEHYHYELQHKGERTPLRQLNRNADNQKAAGAPSSKISRMPVPSDITTRRREETGCMIGGAGILMPLGGEEGSVRSSSVGTSRKARLWTEETDRREREREKRKDVVIGKERVLSATSPPRNEPARLWTAERGRRESDRLQNQQTAQSRLPHAYKTFYAEVSSPKGEHQVGHQKSTLQSQWQRQGWWADDGADAIPVKTQYQPLSPRSAQPMYGIPSHSSRGFEATCPTRLNSNAHGIGSTGNHVTRGLSPARNTMRAPSRSSSLRKWRP
ncbi:hypothetical protein DIPPA_26493 [Diplonema papillatum]|nr:hypothetical protein DIPPA_26493 [Diplonema papillatum]